MSQHSEERASDHVVPINAKARVIPFERPQSELQKAVQQRAQETIDRERDRARQQRPPAWKRAFVLALAAVPVVLTFGAAIGFVSALRQFNTAVFEGAKNTPPQSAQGATPSTAEPDVVILQPYEAPNRPNTGTSPPPVSPTPR
jgi:hypothetical protein